MVGQEARNFIQSLKHLDPGVVRVADRTFCQLTGDPAIKEESDGSIRLSWQDWAHEEVRIDILVHRQEPGTHPFLLSLSQAGVASTIDYVVRERGCTGHPKVTGQPCGNRPVDQCCWHIMKAIGPKGA